MLDNLQNLEENKSLVRDKYPEATAILLNRNLYFIAEEGDSKMNRGESISGYFKKEEDAWENAAKYVLSGRLPGGGFEPFVETSRVRDEPTTIVLGPYTFSRDRNGNWSRNRLNPGRGQKEYGLESTEIFLCEEILRLRQLESSKRVEDLQNRLGLLAMKFRGDHKPGDRQQAIQEYDQVVRDLIASGEWREFPAPEEQLPEEYMPEAFFLYWGLRGNNGS